MANRKGFTYIELILVIGTLLVIALISIKAASLDTYKYKQLIHDLRYIKIQLIRYYEMYRRLPDTNILWYEFMRSKEEGGKFFEDVPRNPFYISTNPADGWRLRLINGIYYIVPVTKENYKIEVIVPFVSINFSDNVNPFLIQ